MNSTSSRLLQKACLIYRPGFARWQNSRGQKDRKARKACLGRMDVTVSTAKMGQMDVTVSTAKMGQMDATAKMGSRVKRATRPSINGTGLSSVFGTLMVHGERRLTCGGSGGGGGGVGLLGQGASGAQAPDNTYGYGGSGGTNGGIGGNGNNGGNYGGGAGHGAFTEGGKGAVRIIWPGTTRQFPSTNTGDM